jgi:TupA-like ATPgrasp
LIRFRDRLAKAYLFCRKRPGLRRLAPQLLRLHASLNMLLRLGRTPGPPDRLFNDFLYHLKVGDELEAPLRRRISDKALCKAYIQTRIGPGRSVPTLALLRTPGEIAAFRPPVYPVAAKPTHSSGRILRIGSEGEWQAAIKTMTEWLSHDYFSISLERNYAGLARQVIVEPWLDESLSLEGSVHCRAGVPKVVSIIERYGKSRQSYDTTRRPLGVSLAFPTTEVRLTDWDFFDPLLQDAASLSAELSYIRVDFYTDGRRVVFGELTNLPAAGLGRFYPANGEAIFSAVFFAPPP